MGVFNSKPKTNGSKSKPDNDATEKNNKQPIQPVESPGIKIVCSNFVKEDLKVLILGPGESGKSTYWRQLRNLYTGGLTPKEKKLLIPAIRINLLTDIKIIVENAETLGCDISASLSNEIDMIKNIEASEEELIPDVAKAIAAVWADPGAKSVYEQIHSCSLSDHSGFFLDNAERIADPDYLPTGEDVIKSRIRTTGVNDIKFDINGRNVLLVDVGGQKCERNKWKSVFTNVNAIIFVISLADFDQTMFESQEERRTTDSLELFKTTVNTQLFNNIPVFLILNKEDELKRKLKLYPDQFKTAYPTYEGSLDDIDAVIKHIEQQYISQATERKPENAIKPFVTCAVNSEQLQQTFLSVSENILTIKKN